MFSKCFIVLCVVMLVSCTLTYFYIAPSSMSQIHAFMNSTFNMHNAFRDATPSRNTTVVSWKLSRNTTVVSEKLGRNMPTFNSKPSYTEEKKIMKAKIILFWNDRYELQNWGFSRVPVKPFKDLGCSETNCVFTDDRSVLKNADAVMFHIVGNMKIRPQFHSKHQRWVFFEHEAACGRWPSLEAYVSDFNWTQTYRLNSDLMMQYGTYCKRDEPIKIDYNSITQKKNKLVAWMVSHCNAQSRRDDYVRELMKYIPVDVYGRCSYLYNQSNICGRQNQNICMQKLDKEYKFYLGFENTFSPDYVTEKYFNMLKINIVPVVRGDGNYTAVGPPNSFINTKDFSNPKQLAGYLHFLNKNDTAYIKYLEWKETYVAGTGCKTQIFEDPWCKMCRKLNNPNEPVKYYPDIYKWFGTCRTPDDITVA